MAKIKITKEQAMMLENLKKNKVIKITESQYKKLIESLNPGQEIDKAFERAIPGSTRQEFKSNRNKLDEGLWESFVNELYGINESSEKVYESLIKIMEACGYVENRKLSKAKFSDKKMAKDVILGGLQTLHETGSPFMAMEAMEEAFKSEKKNPFFKTFVDDWFAKGNENVQVKKYYDDGQYWMAWQLIRRIGDVGKMLQNPKDMEIVGDIKEIDGEEDAPTKMVPINPESEDEVDTITMDVPLFIRALEYSREDAQNDLDLHTIAQNAIMLSKEYGMLTMDNYDEIFGSLENVEPQVEPQSPELNELESEDTPKQYTCNGPQRVVGLDILNYEPFKSLPEKKIDRKGTSVVSLPDITQGDRTEVIFGQDDLYDHTSVHFGEEYHIPGYVDRFKRKYGEEPIFCDIQVNNDQLIVNAKIANLPKLTSLDPRGQGPLDEKEIDEVSSTTGSLGLSSPINPIGYEPKKMETESKIYEALNALKKK